MQNRLHRMNRSKLTPIFYSRRADVVARALLGKYLVLKNHSGVITETEAYMGPHDKASHAHRGRTKRNEPMFGPAGIWYVYLTYGIHWMLNIVTGKEEYPAAVLIRGVLTNEKHYDGPGKLTKHLGIDKRFNTLPALRESGLWIEDRGICVRPRDIQKTPRIGIDYAGAYVHKPWRFVLAAGRGVQLHKRTTKRRHDQPNHAAPTGSRLRQTATPRRAGAPAGHAHRGGRRRVRPHRH